MEEDTDIDILSDFDLDNFLNNNLNEINSPLEEDIFCFSTDDSCHLSPLAHPEYNYKCRIQRKQTKPLVKLGEKRTDKNQKIQDKVLEATCPRSALQTTVLTSPPLLSKKRKKNSQFYMRKRDYFQDNINLSMLKERVLTLNCNSIFTGKNEEIVKLTKIDDNLDEEIEIDIEGSADIPSSMQKSQILLPKPASSCTIPPAFSTVPFNRKRNELPPISSKYMLCLQERMKNVYNLTHPTQEITMDLTHFSKEEEELFPEFFYNTKTFLINRYLTIKSHILNCWAEKRPTYITKTQIRAGLKNCGDVNLISRIHAYLEMKGAINFGCDRCYYIQQLKKTRTKEYVVQENKECDEDWATSVVDKNWDQQRDDISPAIGYEEGGLTLMHDDSGSITKVIVSKYSDLNQILHSSAGNRKKNRNRTSKATRQLIYCKRFPTEKSAPFRISFYLEALLTAEIHCYSSNLTSAKGLFLGWYDVGNHTLHVTTCAPIADAGLTTYDWNSESSKSGYMGNQQFVVGWYFSYPVSVAESSVINQPKHADLRALFTKKATDPFFLLVLSPYSRTKKRCITTVKGYPYLMDYKIIYAEDMCVNDTIKKMKEAISMGNNENLFKEKCEYVNNKTYGQLCYESIRRLLDSTVNVVPSNVKEELIQATKYIVGFNHSTDDRVI